jgi:hypothetical protein
MVYVELAVQSGQDAGFMGRSTMQAAHNTISRQHRVTVLQTGSQLPLHNIKPFAKGNIAQYRTVQGSESMPRL